MGVTRSGYYEWLKHKDMPKKEEVTLKERVKGLFNLSRQSYGWRRTWHALKNEGIKCNHKKVQRIMKELNLFSKIKKKFKATTNSKHNFAVAANHLDRKFNVIKPNVAWVGDITYIWTDEGWLYLATVIDLYSRKVKGWAMSNRMTADLAISALDMALSGVKDSEGLLFHSDRGVQYASNIFKKRIKENKMIQSMSRKACCWDNAVAESFFGSLKQELVYHCRFKTREEAKSAIFEYIEVFYNRLRLHSTLSYRTPDDLEQAALAA